MVRNYLFYLINKKIVAVFEGSLHLQQWETVGTLWFWSGLNVCAVAIGLISNSIRQRLSFEGIKIFSVHIACSMTMRNKRTQYLLTQWMCDNPHHPTLCSCFCETLFITALLFDFDTVVLKQKKIRFIVAQSVRPSVNIYPGCLLSATPLAVMYRSFRNFACACWCKLCFKLYHCLWRV